MDYEKAYKEALERMKSWARGEHPECFSEAKKAAEFIFPELAESADERIRKDCIKYLDWEYTHCSSNDDKMKIEKCIAWLEKQGEQKPIDKVETKQKPNIEKGKWYVCNTPRYTDFEVGKAYYCPKNGMLRPNENEMARYVASHCFHRWTIEDAKDGDVLANNGNIILFKQISDSTRLDYKFIRSYCFVLAHSFNFYLGGTYNLDDGFHPATKEQRDLLFQKMKEAGYTWDAEKKELNEIEQKQSWSEDDEKNMNTIINVIHGGTHLAYENEIDWLKSLKDRIKGE